MSSTKKNIILQTTYQVAALITPFITAPYISRVLGKENVGIYSYTYSIVNYFMVFAMLGIDIYGLRSVAKAKEDKEELNRVFSEIFFVHVLLSVIVLISYFIFVFFLTDRYKIFYLIQVLFIIGELLNINWLFNGLGEFKITVVRNLIIKVLTIILIFACVRKSDDLGIYIGIMAAGTCLSTSAVWIVRKKYVSFVKIDFKQSLVHIRPLLVLFVSIIASSIFRMIDKTMLGNYGYISQLGCYEYADKIIRMPLAIFTGVSTVLMSKTSNMVAKGDKDGMKKITEKTFIFMSLCASLFVFGIMEYGVPFSILYLGEEFEFTGSLLKVLAISLLFLSWADTLRSQFYVPYGKDNSYAMITGGGAVVNIILNAILIRFFGGIGAAIATDVSYFIIVVVELFIARKHYNVGNILVKSILPFLLGVIPLVLLRYVIRFQFSALVNLILGIVSFTIVFMLETLLYLKLTNNLFILKRG